MKLPAHRAAASRKGNFILMVPLDPAYKAGLTGHLPAKEPDKLNKPNKPNKLNKLMKG